MAVSADLSLADTLKRIVTAAAELADARYAALGVPDESGEFLAEFVTSGLSPEEEARIGARPRGHGLLGLILHQKHSLRLRDLRQHPQSVGFPPHHPPMASFLGVPILYKDRVVGNLYLTDKQSADEFTAEDQHLIELLAAHAAIAIEHARLYDQVQRLRVLEERQRFAMDLHDGVIQSIYAVGLQLETIRARLGEDDAAQAQERLGQAIDGLNVAIRDIRAYIMDLRPRRLLADELVDGLEQLLNEFRANTLIDVQLRVDAAAEQALTPPAREALFHVAQEALSNIAKHSLASQAAVQLTTRPDAVEFTLDDNGRGFDPARVTRYAGHGLGNMEERVRAVGGQWSIGPAPDGGTRISVTVPAKPRS